MEFIWKEETPSFCDHQKLTNSSIDFKLPQSRDLWLYPLAIAFSLSFLKYFFFIPFIFTPIAIRVGIKNKKHEPPPLNRTLEVLFKEYNSVPSTSLEHYAESLGMTKREILRWLRLRYLSETNTKINKFIDCSWQLTYYIISCSIGMYSIHDKPWLTDFSQCWTNFPCQALPNSTWWYYMFALGFYFEEIFTHCLQPKKKDSLQLFVHHLCAIFLLSGTWLINVVRLGTINTLIFECNDIPLLTAKLFKYSNKKKYIDVLFAIFIIVWVACRLVIYPFGVMRHTFSEPLVRAPSFFHIYNFLKLVTCVVMTMNLMWTYSIVKVLVKKFQSGEVDDVRSSDDESDSDDENQKED